MVLVIFLIVYLGTLYYFFIGRRRKEQKKKDEMLGTLRPGTRISTISGLVCEIVDVQDSAVIVELSRDSSRSIKARLVKAGVKGIKS